MYSFLQAGFAAAPSIGARTAQISEKATEALIQEWESSSSLGVARVSLFCQTVCLLLLLADPWTCCTNSFEQSSNCDKDMPEKPDFVATD